MANHKGKDSKTQPNKDKFYYKDIGVLAEYTYYYLTDNSIKE